MNIKLDFATIEVVTACNGNIYDLHSYIKICGKTDDGCQHEYFINSDGDVYDSNENEESYSSIGMPAHEDVADYVFDTVYKKIGMTMGQIASMLNGMTQLCMVSEEDVMMTI